MAAKKDWAAAMRPLLRKYKGQKHPLEYHDVYQLLVMVVLSARSTDVHINAIAPTFFSAYKDMQALSGADAKDLFPYLKGVTNFGHKAEWLVKIAQQLKSNSAIPLDMEGLTALPGIGRKSANVILRETGRPAEGIMVDLHTIRVATRLGITKDEDPSKIEERMMKVLPREEWDAGMAMSFLGREICRPKPLCEVCVMRNECAYYKKK
ncbi:MAG: DNA lyase [Sphingobacteriales bacterium 50-39]|nr:endonuclease III [Sphingobacteriales bacterium]OJW55925.1 MAG: DNA lyase [Sphingobacteriales bacterium 50-39]